METILLVLAAAVMEFIDSFLGMMYGTVLSPLLILAGYDAKLVVPALLISQAAGGFIASWRHHDLGNADFSKGTADRKISATIIWFGLFASFIGVWFSSAIPKWALNSYIAVLVIIIGVMLLKKWTLSFTNGKVYVLGFLSAFNKAFSGGGFGPLVAGGQLVLKGREEKGAIGSTDFAEAPICLFSFLIWVYFQGMPDIRFVLPLCAGAILGGFFGPQALSNIVSREKLKMILGGLVLFEGLYVAYKVVIKYSNEITRFFVG